MTQPITCRQFIEFLDEYLAGTQPAHVRATFEKHLAMCPYCVDYLRTYQEAMKLGRGVFADDASPVPDEVPEDLIHAVLEARSKRIT